MRRVLIAALALAQLAAPSRAEARRPTTAELAEDGLSDPRKRDTPPRHRIRLAILSDAMRTSAAIGRDGKTTRFYYATLMLDLAYQVQVFKHLMIRPSFAIGGEIHNGRNKTHPDLSADEVQLPENIARCAVKIWRFR